VSTLEGCQAVLQHMGVRKLGLFGSYRRGTATVTSDIDFLVVLEQPSFDAYMEVKFFLEDLFGCPVDLVLEETIKPRLRPYILGEVAYAQGF
jgi:predicted nucleotidyltransferase